MTSIPAGYLAASTSLSQIMGRIASYLAQPNVSLRTLIHYFGELQEWFDTLPEIFRKLHLGAPTQMRAINFLNLRWLDAVMLATRRFVASLARFGANALSNKFRAFFRFCTNVASIAARKSLAFIRRLESQGMIKALTAFDRHFLLQSAGVLALSSAVELGMRDERLRFRECIELLLRLPGARHGYLIRDMRAVESKLERFAIAKSTKHPYLQFPYKS